MSARRRGGVSDRSVQYVGGRGGPAPHRASPEVAGCGTVASPTCVCRLFSARRACARAETT